MASKKKNTPKKAAKKPVKKQLVNKIAKKAAGKAAKSGSKVAPKKAVKPVAKKAAKPVPKKSGLSSKSKAVKPAPKPVIKAPAKTRVVAKSVDKKTGTPDSKSFVSIKPKVAPVLKKEPVKPLKIVIPKTSTKSSVKYEPEFTRSVLDTLSQPPSTPTMRYSDADLMEFREIIQKKLDAAKKELTYLQGLITRKDQSGDMEEGHYMTMEDGSISMEREQLSQMASRQITFIDHLEKAMMRIENKTYGICRVTGRLIDKARLRAVPHATLSIEAKQLMNK